MEGSWPSAVMPPSRPEDTRGPSDSNSRPSSSVGPRVEPGVSKGVAGYAALTAVTVGAAATPAGAGSAACVGEAVGSCRTAAVLAGGVACSVGVGDPHPARRADMPGKMTTKVSKIASFLISPFLAARRPCASRRFRRRRYSPRRERGQLCIRPVPLLARGAWQDRPKS